jgi:hypothetical protein
MNRIDLTIIMNKFNFMFATLFVAGCAAVPITLPVPISYLNYVGTTYDIKQMLKGDQTLGDQALSAATKKRCRVMNLVNDKKLCKKIPASPLTERMFRLSPYVFQ